MLYRTLLNFVLLFIVEDKFVRSKAQGSAAGFTIQMPDILANQEIKMNKCSHRIRQKWLSP
jgi:hypothetical protein